MNTWCPLFSKIVDSSLWSEPDHVVKVFMTMLALKDADQVVRYTAFALAQRAHKTEREVLDAFKVLSSPDKKRLEPQPYEGRRIERRDDGWFILNGQFYEDLMRSINRRAYKAQKEKEARDDGRRKPKGPKWVKPTNLSGEFTNQSLEKQGATQEELDRQEDSCRRELNGDQSEPLPKGSLDEESPL